MTGSLFPDLDPSQEFPGFERWEKPPGRKDIALVADPPRPGERVVEAALRIGRALFGGMAEGTRTVVMDSEQQFHFIAAAESARPDPEKPKKKLLRQVVVDPTPGEKAFWTTGPRFYLGTHHPGWLAQAGVPLCVSFTSLRRRKTLPEAVERWVMDSGGFTQLQKFGEWTISPREYVEAAARIVREVGRVDWIASQDWMCEDAVRLGGTFKRMRFAGTGLPVEEHLRRTVENFIELEELWPQYSDDPCPVRPPLQGYRLPEYLACWDLYEAYGVDLTKYDTVLLGSVCRRESTAEIAFILSELSQRAALPWHALGMKAGGLEKSAHLVASSDSLAWSFAARMARALDDCRGHKSCSNCRRYALIWYRHIERLILTRPRQYALGDPEELLRAAETLPTTPHRSIA